MSIVLSIYLYVYVDVCVHLYLYIQISMICICTCNSVSISIFIHIYIYIRICTCHIILCTVFSGFFAPSRFQLIFLISRDRNICIYGHPLLFVLSLFSFFLTLFLSLSLSFSFHSFCFSFFSPFFLFLYAHLCSTHGLINNAFVTDQQRVDEFLSLRRRVSSLLFFFFFFFFVLTDTFFPLEFFHSRLLSLRIVGGSSVISRDCR